jgi:hypothetical protein
VAGSVDVADAPTITAPFASFVDAADVVIRSEQPEVDLHYTLDGSEPTADSPRVSGPVRIERTAAVRARAFRGGRAVSPTGAAELRRATPRAAEEVALDRLAPGLRCSSYAGDFDKLPDLAALTPVRTVVASHVDTRPAPRGEFWALRFTGFLRAPQTSVYRFRLTSDDGSRLWIGDALVADNDGLHSAATRTGEIALTSGLHAIRVEMFEKTGGAALTLEWEAPGRERAIVPTEALLHVAGE